jgi:hypothetical protein
MKKGATISGEENVITACYLQEHISVIDNLRFALQLLLQVIVVSSIAKGPQLPYSQTRNPTVQL